MSDDWDSSWGGDKETPAPQVTLKGVEAGEGGLRSHTEGTGFVLRVMPQHGAYKLIPYSRIEEIDVTQDHTHMLIYAARCVVSIQGAALDGIADAFHKGKIWSLSVGKAERNDVLIERIDITNVSDSANIAQ